MDKHIGRGGRPSGGAAKSIPLPPPRSGQCNTQMDEFPIHPPPAGSPRRTDKRESRHKEVNLGINLYNFDLTSNNSMYGVTSRVGVSKRRSRLPVSPLAVGGTALRTAASSPPQPAP